MRSVSTSLEVCSPLTIFLLSQRLQGFVSQRSLKQKEIQPKRNELNCKKRSHSAVSQKAPNSPKPVDKTSFSPQPSRRAPALHGRFPFGLCRHKHAVHCGDSNASGGIHSVRQTHGAIYRGKTVTRPQLPCLRFTSNFPTRPQQGPDKSPQGPGFPYDLQGTTVTRSNKTPKKVPTRFRGPGFPCNLQRKTVTRSRQGPTRARQGPDKVPTRFQQGPVFPRFSRQGPANPLWDLQQFGTGMEGRQDRCLCKTGTERQQDRCLCKGMGLLASFVFKNLSKRGARAV